MELAAVRISLTCKVFLFCSLAIYVQTPDKSYMKNSVALLINKSASFVTIPDSGSKLIICRTLFSGSCINFPKLNIKYIAYFVILHQHPLKVYLIQPNIHCIQLSFRLLDQHIFIYRLPKAKPIFQKLLIENWMLYFHFTLDL